ncbi:probable tRNA N6-adenosine threonylcarbamoyltransferase, mitochondrial isoform X2 [Belonocnema kinseyi]|uniref:probable tRNA N6-adenosine threonylcarbamoyltransferase, mitochondrial isoform X2 n=1 Tax=Belonocnema kinseyi TaxID=2817044 RepID=UPI00143DB83B|nr:probable tRNA N6-adenosine threonylcarbamoyltransferase, mitochondrial isoform X2 [Belonocnema kinseyi]
MIQPLNFISMIVQTYRLRNQWITQLTRSKATNNKNLIVLGIETSCDDTGCGIVDSKGTILGNALYSQHLLHLKYGGIIPPIAQDLHIKNITELCECALKSANMKLHNVDAVAATVKPGLPLSLSVGRNFGVRLSLIGNKPFIPIHHMEAHALVARMTQQIARRLKLKNLIDFSNLNGGQAIEIAASRAESPTQFSFAAPLTHSLDCNFSFSGLKTTALNYILECERKSSIIGDKVIPNIYNLCASYQLAITRHICQRTQRAMEFINRHELLPNDHRTLVISGGVACNDFIFKCLNSVCSEMGFACIRPPSKLCTDNGLMIAWNGMERLMTNSGILTNKNDIANVDIEKKSPVGKDWTSRVREENIKCKWIKIKLHKN